MKAVRFHKTGGPEVLVYEDVADPEESHTLGNIDPPRGPTGTVYNFPGRPFGATHELVGLASAIDRSKRKRDSQGLREVPVAYDEVISPEADCPVAKAWLLHARQKSTSKENPNALNWDSEKAGRMPQLCNLGHGLKAAGISSIATPMILSGTYERSIPRLRATTVTCCHRLSAP